MAFFFEKLLATELFRMQANLFITFRLKVDRLAYAFEKIFEGRIEVTYRQTCLYCMLFFILFVGNYTEVHAEFPEIFLHFPGRKILFSKKNALFEKIPDYVFLEVLYLHRHHPPSCYHDST